MNYKRTVGFAIKALANEIMRYIENTTQHSEVTGMQRGILSFIANSTEDIYQREIEKEFCIRRSTATGILQLMEKNGLITREGVDHDARLKKIALTDKAFEIKLDVQKEMEDFEEMLTKDISDKELDVFFNVIEKLIKNICCRQ